MHFGVYPVQPPSAVHERVTFEDKVNPGRHVKKQSLPHSSPMEQCLIPFSGLSKGVHCDLNKCYHFVHLNKANRWQSGSSPDHKPSARQRLAVDPTRVKHLSHLIEHDEL